MIALKKMKSKKEIKSIYLFDLQTSSFLIYFDKDASYKDSQLRHMMRPLSSSPLRITTKKAQFSPLKTV
jgi:hypothetical protein